MTEVVFYVLTFGPIVLVAAVLGTAVSGLTPWLWKHPQRWLFWLVLALGFIQVGGDGALDGSIVRQVTWGGLFTFCVARLIADARNGAPTGLRAVPPTLLLLVGLAFISILWSPIPLTSFKRAMQLVGVVAIGLVAARNLRDGHSLETRLRLPTFTLVAVGLFTAVAAPSLAFDADGSLRAFTSHKNTWGQNSLLACLVMLFAALSASRNRWLIGIAFLLSLISLAMSRSATSVLTLLLFIGVFAVWRAMTGKSAFQRAMVGVAGMSLVVALHVYVVMTGEFPTDTMLTTVLSMAGKEQTLTGRTALWQLMYAEIDRHAWFGIGYGGFWAGPGGPSSMVAARLNWGPPGQAHSGYIDILNELGYLGLLATTAVIGAHARNIFSIYRSPLKGSAAFHAALLVSAIIINYAESSLFRTTHIWWVVLCASIIEAQTIAGGLRRVSEARNSHAAVQTGNAWTRTKPT